MGPGTDTLAVIGDACPEPAQGFERRAATKDVVGDGVASWIEVRVQFQFRRQRLAPRVKGEVDDLGASGVRAGIPASAPFVLALIASNPETGWIEPFAPPPIAPVVGFQRALGDHDRRVDAGPRRQGVGFGHVSLDLVEPPGIDAPGEGDRLGRRAAAGAVDGIGWEHGHSAPPSGEWP